MKRKKFRLYQKNNKGKLWKITLIIQKIPKGGQKVVKTALVNIFWTQNYKNYSVTA